MSVIPFIIRSPEGDKFYLIATDLKINGGNGWDAAQNSGSQSLMIWESTDLVNWSEQRMVEVSAKIEAGCTWAPEATYDPQTGEILLYTGHPEHRTKIPNRDCIMQRPVISTASQNHSCGSITISPASIQP